MAAIMTIVEITKSLPERAELADLRGSKCDISLSPTFLIYFVLSQVENDRLQPI
jgi:hypothetical protein